MVFSDPIFYIFYIIFFLFFLTAYRQNIQFMIILFSSSLFIYYGEGWVLVFYWCLAILTYVLTYFGNWGPRISIAICILSIVIVKYMEFLFSWLGFSYNQSAFYSSIYLIIGWSFLVFQAISFSVDYGVKRKEKDYPSFLLYMCYMLSFFQLLAGPIVRLKSVYSQYSNLRITSSNFIKGLELFILGLGCKVIIADELSLSINLISDGLGIGYGMAEVYTIGLFYSLQLYFDFSGYSLMAIGMARSIGVHFPKNFNYPYKAINLTDFWRRWHISLSSFFKDYVYIPLGGSRVSSALVYRNLIIVFFITGLWHGASYAFIIWGLLHGLLLIFEKNAWKIIINSLIYKMFLIQFIIFTWILFYFGDFEKFIDFIFNFKGYGGDVVYTSVSNYTWVIMFIGVFFSIITRFRIYLFTTKLIGRNRANFLNYVLLFVIMVWSLLLSFSDTPSPFIYFKF